MSSPRSFGAATTAAEDPQHGDEPRARDPERWTVPESPVGETSASGA